MDDNKDNDLVQRLRTQAATPFGPEGFDLLTQAASEIERLAAQVAQSQSAGSARQGGITSDDSSEKSAAAIASQSQAAQPTADLPRTMMEAIMENLSDRRGVFDDIDGDIMDEIREEMRTTVAAHIAGTSQATNAQAEPNRQDTFAVRFIEQRAAQYLRDHASTEADTGALVFEFGEAGREYHYTLVELAEDIRGALGDERMPVTNVCNLPPAGWNCSRVFGHAGPCAASPVASVAKEAHPHYRKATTELSLPELAEQFAAVAKLGGDYTLSAGVCAMLHAAMTTPPVAKEAEKEQQANEEVPGIPHPTTYAELASITPEQLWNRWYPCDRSVSAREAFIAARRIPFVSAALTTQQAAKAESEGEQAHVMPPTRGTGGQRDAGVAHGDIVAAYTRWMHDSSQFPHSDDTRHPFEAFSAGVKAACRFRAQGGNTNTNDSNSVATPTTSTVSAPSNEDFVNVWELHGGHPADFAADVLERWGGWPAGVLGQGGSTEGAQAAPEDVRNQALTDAEDAARSVMDAADEASESAESIGAFRCINAIQYLRTSTDQANADTGSAE